MSWSIEVIVNNVKIPKTLIKELFDAQKGEEIWYDVNEVTYDAVLSFNPDHMEHMDFLGTNKKIVSILKRAKLTGDICFGSLDGDNSGSFWGYRFDGEGGMKTLEGNINWTVSKKA